MVLRMLFIPFLLILTLSCSSVGYVRYEKIKSPGTEELSTPEKSEKYPVKEYYLVPNEWWLDYPSWHWSIGFFLWEPYWWYPYYYSTCPGCYLFDPYIFNRGHRQFERNNPSSEPSYNVESPSHDPDFTTEKNIKNHRQFRR